MRGGPPDILSPGEAADIPCPAAPDLDARRAPRSTAPPSTPSSTPAEGRRKRLLVADMDSTIVTGETLDELAAFAGLSEQIAAITRRSMNGELDFADALRERVAHAAAACRSTRWSRPGRATALTPGARELVATMRAHGAHDGAGLRRVHLLHRPGRRALRASTCTAPTCCSMTARALTGEVGEPILDRDAKLATLRELAAARGLALAATLAVGDGANDLDDARARPGSASPSTPSRSWPRRSPAGSTTPTCGRCCSRRAIGPIASSGRSGFRSLPSPALNVESALAAGRDVKNCGRPQFLSPRSAA